MEPRGLQLVAINSKSPEAPEAQEQAKTVAVGCDQLPETFHGKEGVDGSSPSEGFAEPPANHRLVLSMLVTVCHARALPGVPLNSHALVDSWLPQAILGLYDPLCQCSGDT
jgi:hypothetical protein